MKNDGKAEAGGAHPRTDERSRIIAAYREGSGLAGIAIISDAAGTRIRPIASNGDPAAEGEGVQARLWCDRAADAEYVATVAARQILRRESREGGAICPGAFGTEDSLTLSLMREAVLAAAQRRNITLHSDDEVADTALRIALHIEGVMEKLQRSGGMKTMNHSYRKYRLEAREGERVMSYGEWRRNYKVDLVRKTAKALRQM